MPELPEVHTITTDLKKHLENAKILNVKFVGNYQAYPNNEAFIKTLTNNEMKDFGLKTEVSSSSRASFALIPGLKPGVFSLRITKISRLAKNIIFHLEAEYYVQIHLAMTGRLLLRSSNFKRDTHERIIFTLELKNKKIVELRFTDTRMFGKVRLLNKIEYADLKEKYGPEPINNQITSEKFHKIILSRKTNIKNLLMDQTKIAGMGNAYTIDALWIAKIHPETSTQSITFEQAALLLEACREILNEGIKNRGLTIDSYVDAFGKPGKQQDFFRVYRKENCIECNTKIEFTNLNGRGTFFCPICQIKDNQARLL